MERQKRDLKAGGARLFVVMRRFIMLMIVTVGVTKAPWQIWQMMVVHHDSLHTQIEGPEGGASLCYHSTCTFDRIIEETQKVVD